MYALYNIKGINTFDTPQFNSLSAQQEWFNSRKVVQIDEIYPPYFTNNIVLEISQVPLNKSYNYLSLDYENKTYYYFINDIQFTNYGNYSISITMDTIQTFMFNLNFNSYTLERECIKRWNSDGTINREYVRENLSNAQMINEIYSTYNADVNWFVVITTEGNGSRLLQKNINNAILDTNLKVYLIPYGNFSNELRFYRNNTYEYVADATAPDLLYTLSKNTKIVSINYVNNPILNTMLTLQIYDTTIIEEGVSTDVTIINFDSSIATLVDVEISSGGSRKIINLNYSDLLSNIISDFSFDYYKNTNVGVLKRREFVPQLIDENYYNFKFGEKLGFTGYPLHKTNKQILSLISGIDLTTNVRWYQVKEKDINNDIYLTNIINATNEQLTLINDAWLQYQAQYQGSLTTGVKLAKQQNLYSFITGSLKSVADFGSSVSSGRTISGGINSVSNIGLGTSDFIQGEYVIDKQLQITRENKEFTPDTVKQGNTCFADINSNALDIFASLEIVADINDVAEKYELFGYKQHKEVYNNNLLQINNRYYYDVIKATNLNINFKNYPQANALLNDVISRIENGLRLWHIINTSDNEMINDIIYDNVEVDYVV